MLLRFDNGDPYATGATPYGYGPATNQEITPRIIITVSINDFKTSAFVDTGGIFIITPEVALHLGLDAKTGISTPNLGWRGSSLPGVLHRVSLTLQADEGHPLTIEATAFVPQLSPYDSWPGDFPCILGMSGCLERLRFAVDPFTDTFYFGELSEQ